MVWQKQYSPPGAPPGTLRPSEDGQDVRITAMHFTATDYGELNVTDLESDLASLPQDEVLWVNVDGVANPSVIAQIGRRFDLHPLCLEDVMNLPQRSKIEDYDHYDFLIFRMAIDYQIPVRTEQVSLFLGDRYVITFQEQPGDAFDPVRRRIRQGRGHLRRSGSDYLAYALLRCCD